MVWSTQYEWSIQGLIHSRLLRYLLIFVKLRENGPVVFLRMFVQYSSIFTAVDM
jgi:hypothetical protein